jgi:chaperone protein EcpD
VQWSLESQGTGFALKAYNPSAFHVSQVELSLVAGGQRYASENGMVGPGETRMFPLPTLKARPGSEAAVEFNAINDYGALLPTRQALKP